MNNPYQIVAHGEVETDVFIYGDIGGWNEDSVHAAKLIKDLAAVKAPTINLRINSFGGAVADALAIHNSLRKHAAKKHVYVEGIALSAASLIAMAGDTISMHEGSIMMIHGPAGIVMGPAPDMRQLADVLDKFASAMTPIYARKSGKPEGVITTMLTDGKDYWYTPAEAKEEGFADAVIPAREDREAAEATGWMSTYEVPLKIAAMWRSSLGITMKVKNPESVQAAGESAQSPIAPPKEPVSEAPVVAADANQIAMDELNRGLLIRQHVTDARLDAKMADSLIKDRVPLAKAREQILNALATRTSEVEISGAAAIHLVEDERDKFVDGAGQWVMAKAGLKGLMKKATGTDINAGEFRGLTMVDLARMSLERAGVSTKGMDKMKIVAQAFTFRAAFGQPTSDFTKLLENTLHKVLLASFNITPDTWSRWCSVGSVSDFRPHHRYMMGSFGALETVTENDEFRNKPFPDAQRESISAKTKGNIIAITRQAMINDDMGAFNSLATMLGRAAKLTVETDVYTALLSNSGGGPILASDGLTLFHANHQNISIAPGAPNPTTIDADRVLMATKTDISGNEILDLRPKIWLGPIGLGGAIRTVNEAQYDPETANKLQRPNSVRGLYADIVDTARLPMDDWYSFADPQVAPVMEVAFLDGEQEPFLESQQGWRVDGTEWKVRMDYGVAGVGYIGAIVNRGS